jgi:ATP-dependent exoDNAse (exonuclease V) beta subunit
MEEVGFEEQYQKERNNSLLDMINLVYVAFTRAAERLYVITREPANGDAVNLPGLLKQFIESNPDKWEQSEAVFTRGKDEYQTKGIKVPEGVHIFPGGMISTPWQGRIKIARRAPVYWSADSTKNKQAWGTIIHDTLAAVRSVEDVAIAVAKQSEANSLSAEDTAMLEERVIATVNQALLNEYFDKKAELKPEAGILTPEGNVYRPDRVVFYKDQTVIMEFKTGMPEPKHRSQLENYGHLLEQMGYPAIRKLLVYINETVNVEVL